METIEQVIEKIAAIAASNGQDQSKRVVNLPRMKVGTCYRQGDLNIFRVADDHPVGKPLARRQLADGESIGQRHVLLGEFQIYEGTQPPNIKFKDKAAAKFVLGYAFDITGPARNNHPEHSDFIFGEGCEGRYQVMHQMNIATRKKMED